MSEVFISYVREDERVVRHLANILEANGVKTWLDKNALESGVRWKIAIENAIRRGTFFLSVYSRAREAREKSYANEELVVAIEEIRKRPSTKTWFVPVQIDECEIDARSIGGGETILDFQKCDLREWVSGVSALLHTLGVLEPKIDPKQPLAPGLPSALEIESGFIRYEVIEGAPEVFQGMEHRVTTGWCRRDLDNSIMAYFELYAPLRQFQDLNRLLGYTSFHAFCEKQEISVDASKPSIFKYHRRLLAPAGTPFPSMDGQGMIPLPFDLPFGTSFIATGSMSGYMSIGTFEAELESEIAGRKTTHRSSGLFEITMRAPKKLILDGV